MLKRISIRCVGSGGVVDLPGYGEGTLVLVYGDQHGGDNQAFHWDTRVGDISSVVVSHMVLKMREDGKVVLGKREGDVRERWVLGSCGVLDDIESKSIHCGSICSMADKAMLLTDKKGELVVEQIRDECPHQTWEIVKAGAEEGAKPATSCHLKYPLPAKVETSSTWQLECSVVVRSSSPASYFCVVGWGPAGYSGIQEVDIGRRVAIFSMWNHGESKVSLVSKGEGVTVDDFGGEGTGLKTMRNLDWSEGDVVTFIVNGKKDDADWTCSCYFIHQGETHFMAAYRRPGQRPLNRNGFYSFVEDWDRSSRAQGHNTCRRAEFRDQKLIIDDRGFRLRNATFTKVEDGRDKFAKKKAKGGKEGKGFFLSSGGQDDDSESECHNGVCFDC